jgi:predicted N-acetyltransferase YhbS
MLIRELHRDEIEKIWTIDRGEVVENIYYLREGKLVLQPEYYDIKGWPPGEQENYTRLLVDCFDRGGTFLGAYNGEELVGVTILESKFIGSAKDQLQLKFLHVSREQRKQGLGSKLFQITMERARELGAKRLYISATPSENTVNFYLNLGCILVEEIDAELF